MLLRRDLLPPATRISLSSKVCMPSLLLLVWYSSLEKRSKLHAHVWTRGSTLGRGDKSKVRTCLHIHDLYSTLVLDSTEWKVDKDSKSDTHRHLSHLIGLYPGYSLASYADGDQSNLKREEVLDAARTSLIRRGDGNGPDADSGWEKVWRAAAWAQLQDPAQFYHLLTVSGQGHPPSYSKFEC